MPAPSGKVSGGGERSVENMSGRTSARGKIMAEDLGSLLGQLLGGGPKDAGGRLLASLLGALGSSGGQSLSGLLRELGEGGLGQQARSWIGTGANEGVTGPQVAQALPYQVLEAVARQLGLSPEQAADQLAQALPVAVDKLTPDGRVPEGSLEELIKQYL
ncbi:MAG: YidB family protein [Actinomycetota bacterium]|nr:YidB family protein [Actinomycetota bacterium]